MCGIWASRCSWRSRWSSSRVVACRNARQVACCSSVSHVMAFMVKPLLEPSIKAYMPPFAGASAVNPDGRMSVTQVTRSPRNIRGPGPRLVW
ncbi:hypothetical protein SBRY_30216 [Actinacidiphila bryophytorum]|uniref:Uncharacterized protein n=1 Tax=Actinacidiphila bryophytorum TaxID=1436133 RepID=A0A9W4MGC3_9ACTN|nr:hypothetical protein SBRY_30216 [Actinacidiphila bryophytorum]